MDRKQPRRIQMRVTLTDEEVAELEELVEETLRDMSYEIAATDNSQYRARLIARRRLLQSVVTSLRQPEKVDVRDPPAGTPIDDRTWRVELMFTEDDDRTRADAQMHAAPSDWHGWGRARRNPLDPDVPAIGEELAAARALSDLAHQLVDAAEQGVEAFEGRPVRLHP
jgi:Rv2632c-like